MMTERTRLKAEAREIGKKGVLHSLRKTGRIPAVLYGRGSQPVNVSVNAKEMTQAIRSAGLNALMELELQGHQEKQPLVVMIKELQTDVLSHQIIHMDFLKIDMKEKVTVSIPVRLLGKPIGVTKGGLIDQPRREIEVKCLPGNIPEAIDIEISSLDIGDKIHINDLKFPQGVEAPHDANFVIVSVAMPREEEAAPEAPAATEAAPAAAGEAGAGAAAPEAAPAAAKKEEKGEKK